MLFEADEMKTNLDDLKEKKISWATNGRWIKHNGFITTSNSYYNSLKYNKVRTVSSPISDGIVPVISLVSATMRRNLRVRKTK